MNREKFERPGKHELLIAEIRFADHEQRERTISSSTTYASINAFLYGALLEQVSVESVLNIRGFDLKRALEKDPEFLSTDREHQRDASVSILRILHQGEVDLERVQQWMASVLKTQGPDIFRVKGVLAVAHAKKKYVYEAVGCDETCDGTFGEDWGKDEVRESKLVFIGKNLDETVLNKE